MVIPSRDVVKAWCWDAGERAVKTGAQVVVAAMGTSATFGSLDMPAVLSMTGYAMVLSVITSVASFNSSQTGTASLVGVGPYGKHSR